jgi:hypothetical protein
MGSRTVWKTVVHRALTVLAWLAALVLAFITAIANFRYGLLVAAGEERRVYGSWTW